MDIEVGCRFEFDVPEPTHAVVLVEPHPDEGGRISGERFSITPDTPSHSYLDRFDNRCRRLTLDAGNVSLEFTAMTADDGEPDVTDEGAAELAPSKLPDEALMFLLPSRYCQSDELASFAFERFGRSPRGWVRVQEIVQFVHDHIGFDYGAASPSHTAVDVLREGHGVCRDFAHLAITLCRALNIPARYVFGYLPDIAVPDPGHPMDFCAWMEVYLADRWYTFDPRNNQHRIGRTVIGRGRDAADVAMVTTFGMVTLQAMSVVASEVV